MNVSCSAKVNACPVLLSSACVFYEGENLLYIGVNMNDNLQTALEKINDAFSTNISSLSVISPLQTTGGLNPTLSILQSSSSSNGYLSSTDWTTFNSKQAALSGTGFVKISGTTISYDNSTYYLASNPNNYIPLTALSSIATGLTYTNTTGVFSLTSGYLIPTTASYNNTNWDTAYTNRITSLTTIGTSGAATLIANTLNIPQYQAAGNYVTSVTGTSPIVSSGGTTPAISIPLGTSSVDGYLSATDRTNFQTAYSNRITSLTTTGTGAATLVANVLNIPTPPTATFISLTTTGNSGASTLSSGVLNVPTYTLSGLGGQPLATNLTSLSALTYASTAFVKMTAAGTFALDTNTYLTSITSSDVITALGYTPVTNARTLTINGTSYDLTANRSWSVGTVTSVGISMPSAFNVASSPVTGSGTIAVTGAGLASQYVRGDGTLANFPTSTGGGSSFSYYLNGSVDQGTIGGVAFKQMSKTPVIGAGTDFTINANGYIQSFITDAGDPALLNIPAGNWNFEMYFSSSSAGGSPSFYLELYKWNGTTLSLIATNSATPEVITNGTVIDLYTTALAVPATTLLSTDRLAIRVYVIHSSNTITLHTEDSHLCEIITTFSTGLTALNGLTAQVQNFATGTSGTDFAISSSTSTHTFNLPTASAINRGALSSSDWSIFNGKESALTFSSPLSRATNTISIPVATTSVNGYLSSTDWTTFNGKQAALTLTTTGTSGAATLVGATLNIPQYSGTNIYNSDGTLTTARIVNGTSGLTFAVAGITINHTSTNIPLTIKRQDDGNVDLTFINTTYSASSAGYVVIRNGGNFLINSTTEDLWLGIGGTSNWNSPSIALKKTTGNVVIGGTTDAGYKLDVQGTARVTGDLTILNNKLVVQNISDNTAPTMISLINTGSGSGTGATFQFSYSSSLSLTYSNGFTFTHNGSAITSKINNTGIFTNGSLNAATNLNFEQSLPATIKSFGQSTDAFTFIGGGSFLFQNYIGSYDTRFAILKSTGNIVIQNGGTFTDLPSARLIVNSTTQGFLPPRMTTSERNAIASPATGLQVYDTTLNSLNVYNGTSWVSLTSANIYNSDGTLTGDRTISTATGFKLIFNPKIEVVTTTYNVTAGMAGWWASNGYVTTTIPASTSFSGTGYGFSSLIGNNYMTYAGSATFAADTLTGSVLGINNISFTAASSTITITQASGPSIRTYSAGLYQNTTSGSVNGTITHMSGLAIRPLYRASGSSTITVTNNYGLLINDQNSYSHATITNRWGVYQEGASDANYFASSVEIAGVLKETITTNRQTASYSLILSDRGKLVEMNVATANTLTVPLNSSIAFPIGTKIDVTQYGAGATTITATSGVTIRSFTSFLKIAGQYAACTLVKIGTDEWYCYGNLIA